MNWLNRYADLVYCIVRILIGLMFACHGGNKIFFFRRPNTVRRRIQPGLLLAGLNSAVVF